MWAGFKVTQIAQMTQISSLLFHVPQIARITQILSHSGLRAPGISEPRCKDTEMVRGNSQLLILAHGCSYFLIDFLWSGICKLVDYAA